MSAISVRLPDSLHDRVKEVAKRENVSINQMITLALAEKLSALETEDYLSSRAARASREAFHEALANVADTPPDDGDRI